MHFFSKSWSSSAPPAPTFARPRTSSNPNPNPATIQPSDTGRSQSSSFLSPNGNGREHGRKRPPTPLVLAPLMMPSRPYSATSTATSLTSNSTLGSPVSPQTPPPLRTQEYYMHLDALRAQVEFLSSEWTGEVTSVYMNPTVKAPGLHLLMLHVISSAAVIAFELQRVVSDFKVRWEPVNSPMAIFTPDDIFGTRDRRGSEVSSVSGSEASHILPREVSECAFRWLEATENFNARFPEALAQSPQRAADFMKSTLNSYISISCATELIIDKDQLQKEDVLGVDGGNWTRSGRWKKTRVEVIAEQEKGKRCMSALRERVEAVGSIALKNMQKAEEEDFSAHMKGQSMCAGKCNMI